MRISTRILTSAILLCSLAAAPLVWAHNAMFYSSNTSSVPGNPVFINSITQGIPGITGGTTSMVNMAGASFCEVSVSWFDGGFPPVLTSTPSNTWVPDISKGTGASFTLDHYHAYSPSVSSTMTFTITSAANTFPSVTARCFSGTIGSTVDQTNGVNSVSASSPQQTGSVTPSSDHEIIITSIQDGGASGYAINSGFTTPEFVGISGGQYIGIASSYLIQSTAAAVNPSWSWTGSAAGATVIATFR